MSIPTWSSMPLSRSTRCLKNTLLLNDQALYTEMKNFVDLASGLKKQLMYFCIIQSSYTSGDTSEITELVKHNVEQLL